MSDTDFPPLTQAEQLFYDVAWLPLLRAGEVWLEGQVPFLNIPGVKDVDEAVLKAVADYIFDQLRLVLDVTAIKFVDAAHEAAYEKSSVTLKLISMEKGRASPEYEEARKHAEEEFALYLRFGAAGSVT